MQTKPRPGEDLDTSANDWHINQNVKTAPAQRTVGRTAVEVSRFLRRRRVGVEEGVASLLGQQPRADERRQGLARFGEKRRGTEHQRGNGLVAVVKHEVLVDQVADDQVQQLARAFRENTIAGRKGGNGEYGSLRGEDWGSEPIARAPL